MEYLTVGTNNIKRDLFVPISDKNGSSIKPKGGLWLTRHDSRYSGYNEWVDYLMDNPSVLFYKSMGYKNTDYNIWNQPCSLVKLTDDSKIFTLEDTGGYEFLMSKYPQGNSYFSYEAMSQDYDGIFVDVMKLLSNDKYMEQKKLVRELAVKTLLLYNLDCIDYYYPGNVSIKPFDLDYSDYEELEYKINIEKTRKKVR